MATRFYLPSSGSPDVTPSSWIFTNQINPVTYKGTWVRSGTTMTTRTQATGTTSPTTRAMVRYVIGPLNAQTISGTMRLVIRASESAAGANANLAAAVKIIQSSGADRATLLGVTSSDSASAEYEIETTLNSRKLYNSSETEPVSLTSQSASDGDYLVIEIGFRSATTVSRNIALRLGDAASSDLANGSDEVNDYNGWVEFSQNISVKEPSLTINQATHGHTADNVAVGVDLYVQDARSTHTADNLVLTPHLVTTLVISDGSHLHSAGEPSFTQHHVLSIDAIAHGHTAENIAITQHHSLAVAGSTHSHSAESPVLDEKYPSSIVIRGNEGYLSFAGSANSYARAIAKSQNKSNFGLAMKFKFLDNTNRGVFRTFMRASRDWNDWQTPTRAYEVAINNDGNWVVNRIVAGSRTQIGSYTWVASDAYQHLKFEVKNYEIRVKVWEDGQGEPNWQQTIDDTASGFTTAGTFQLGYFYNTDSHAMVVDDVDLHDLGAELVINSGLHSHTADTVSLTQHHVLVLQDAIHAHTAENVSLTQHHVLAINQSGHAHASENVVLTQKHVLQVQDSLHGQTSENVVLTQDHTLVVQDSLHSHTADSLSLTQVHTLVVDSALHSHSADNVTLESTILLVINDSAHSHSAENLTILRYEIVATPIVDDLNTTKTNNLGPDGFTWAQGHPVLVDKYNKIIIPVVADNGIDFVVSNDAGASWFDNLNQPAILRGSLAYDPTHDIIHALWKCMSVSDGMLYRRYTISRDGSNNITDIVRDMNVNLQLDYRTAGGTIFFEHPVLLWMDDAEFGEYGALLAMWGINQEDGTNTGKELRASMRVLSNTSSDNVASNWKAPVTDSTSTIDTDARVPYSIIYNTTDNQKNIYPSANRKIFGVHAKDIYVTFASSASQGITYYFRRMIWNTNTYDWSTGLSSVVEISPNVRSGTNGGYVGNDELCTEPREDPVNDDMVFGFANWKDDTNGTTWSYVRIHNDDTISDIVDVYSGGASNSGGSIFITGDLVTDQGYVIVSYTDLPNKAAYIRAFDSDDVQAQDDTFVWNTMPVDIPTLWQMGISARYDNGNGDKLLVAFRDFNEESANNPPTYTPPYKGYFGTLNWVLPEVYRVNISGGSHSHSADNVTLSQTHVLQVQGAEHAHTADNLDLVQIGTLGVNSTTHQHTADNVVLTQHHVLVISESTHGHTADNVSLSQIAYLEVQSANHSHTADSLNLTQVHSLAIQGSSHGHTAENVTLVYHYILEMQDSQHSHTAENVVLSQKHVLAINDALHAHTADNVTMVMNLNVADAIHGHTSENVVLTQHHSLIIQDSRHTHTANNLGLTGQGFLTVQDARHSHTAENIILTQVHSLVIQGALHAHVAENATLMYHYTLAVQDGLHSHTTGAISLSQHHYLVVQDATHSHTSDNLSIGQISYLIVQGSSHSHSADNVLLSQVHKLTVNDGQHSHTSDNITLTQVHHLSISDATHGHTSDNIHLAVAGVLGIMDARHNHFSDGLSLAQHHYLTIADAAHSHTVENITLSQLSYLAVQSGTHAHTADNISISQDHYLSISDSRHLHTAENIGFVQYHHLSVADATHAHLADSLNMGQTAYLTVQGISHSHTADNISLSQRHFLSVSGSAHALSTENVSISQHHYLVTQDAHSSLSSENISLSQDHYLFIEDSSHSQYAENLVLAVTSYLDVEDSYHLHYADLLNIGQVHYLTIADSTHRMYADALVFDYSLDIVDFVVYINRTIEAETSINRVIQARANVNRRIDVLNEER